MKITIKTVKQLQKEKGKRNANKGHGWATLGKIEADRIRVALKNVVPPFFEFFSICMEVAFMMLGNHLCS